MLLFKCANVDDTVELAVLMVEQLVSWRKAHSVFF